MPCRSDYMEATGKEKESKKICEHLVYVITELGEKVPTNIKKASKEYYGIFDSQFNKFDVATQTDHYEMNLDDLTAKLCSYCKNMTEEQENKIIYNAKNKKARKLADWWEKHQEFDKQRIKQEKKEKADAKAKAKALAKLTPKEKKLLGL